VTTSVIREIDALIRRDPAARGLCGGDPSSAVLLPNQLEPAALDLLARGRHVGIVTGFFVPEAQPPAAETDGPPGAVVLAVALQSIGIHATIITDDWCASAVRAAARAAGCADSTIAVCPAKSEPWITSFYDHPPGQTLTHLIAIERVGPSHDQQSLLEQRRSGPAPLAEFLGPVPSEHRDRCHNARGVIIDDYTAPLHRLFEIGPHRPHGLSTIGIGDGGNEIGMGCVPWEDLVRRLPRPEAARTCCRIATDWNIIAGTSNWGGFALAAATLSLANRTEALAAMDEAYHRQILETMVTEGPALDGMIRRFEPTVDGLPFTTYIQTWLGIRRLLGL
jgi:D-glutamate cyclase